MDGDEIEDRPATDGPQAASFSIRGAAPQRHSTKTSDDDDQ